MSDIEKTPETLEQWTQLLSEQECRIFSNTAQNIYTSLDDKNKGAMELASIILQDPNLTAKLLKVSNSTFYNPSNQKMNTVSRAIVILGSKLIRELTIACSFFESIISPENKQRANEEIAFAIHSAVQAKEIAIASNDPAPEEIFIAALLNNIGQIAFWCFGGKQCKYISDLVHSGQYDYPDAEHKVLGFQLSELGKELCKSWKLGELIEKSISNPSSTDPRTQSVLIGKEITQAINLGWDSDLMDSCLKKLQVLLGEDTSTIISKLKKGTESAVKIAYQFGAHDASHFIQSDSSHQPVADYEQVDQKQLQFHILQDITHHINDSINLNLLFEMVVEGIHRGIGMDRTLFCLFSADKKTLNEKLSLGWFKKLGQQKLKFEISSLPANLFFKAIHSSEGIWADPIKDCSLYTPYVLNSIGKTECFLIPVISGNKPIGLIYADCSINNKPLSEEDFKITKHFVQQAIIGLALYKKKSTPE